MPFLKFDAIDAQGKPVSGTMQANSEAELRQMLESRGLKMVTQAAQRPVAPSQVSRPAAPRANPAATPTPASSFNVNVTDVPNLLPSRHFFLFSRWSDLTRAGFGQADILSQLQGSMNPRVVQMLREMQGAISNGSNIADQMAKRPMQFAPNVVDTIRVGEMSGRLPEAFSILAEGAKRSYSFGGFKFYGLMVIPPMILMSVTGIAIGNASVKATRAHFNEEVQKQGNESDIGFGARVFRDKVNTEKPLFWGGIAVSIIYLIVFIIMLFPWARMIRHTVSYFMPVLMQRARAEAVELFSWALGAALQAGNSPASAIHLAAGSIPNLYLRKKVLNSLGPMRENTSVVDATAKSGLFGHTELSLIQTGTMVGTPDQALDQISKMQKISFDRLTRTAQVLFYLLGMLAVGIAIGTVVGMLYYKYASNMVDLLNRAGDAP